MARFPRSGITAGRLGRRKCWSERDHRLLSRSNYAVSVETVTHDGKKKDVFFPSCGELRDAVRHVAAVGFIPKSRRRALSLVAQYEIRRLCSPSRVATKAVENTNYYLHTSQGDFTSLRSIRQSGSCAKTSLPFFFSICMEHLAPARLLELPPAPAHARPGEETRAVMLDARRRSYTFLARPRPSAGPTATHLRVASSGAALAQMHGAGAGFRNAPRTNALFV